VPINLQRQRKLTIQTIHGRLIGNMNAKILHHITIYKESVITSLRSRAAFKIITIYWVLTIGYGLYIVWEDVSMFCSHGVVSHFHINRLVDAYRVMRVTVTDKKPLQLK